MGTKYKHRVTIACPEALMAAANQLALVSGESSGDVNTFSTAGYEDTAGNKYAVCSTVVTDSFLGIQAGLPSELPVHAESADTTLAQQALDALVIWGDNSTLNAGKLTMVVGIDPIEALTEMGLTGSVD